MSNLLYCCTLPESIQLSEGEPQQALLRLYGDQSRNCDMSLQVQIFNLLSMRDLGPKLYGDFEDGRLEEFLPSSSLTCEELMDRDISRIIARKLATVHSFDVPMSKNNTWILERFTEWLDFIKSEKGNLIFAEGTRESTIRIANELLAIDYDKEIKFLCKVFDGTDSPIVFSHNDLHQGNILLAKPTKRRSKLEKRVILIDFEYCSYNYRAYDIANHFCEWCFEYDTPEYPHFAMFEERFPSEEIRRDFIKNYLDQQRQLPAKIKSSNGHHTNGTCKTHQSNGKPLTNGHKNGYSNGHHANNDTTQQRAVNGNHIVHVGGDHDKQISTINGLGIENGHSVLDIDDDEIDVIMNEVRPFCMAANLVWTLWCIKSAHSSNIRFGYWEHAMTRWQLYLRLKKSYLKETLLETTNNNNIYNIINDNGSHEKVGGH